MSKRIEEKYPFLVKHPYNKVILGLSILFALVGGIGGFAMLVFLLPGNSQGLSVKVLFAPLCLGFLGYLLGIAAGVLFRRLPFWQVLKARSG